MISTRWSARGDDVIADHTARLVAFEAERDEWKQREPDQVMIETRLAQERERFESDVKVMQERHVIEIERLQTLVNELQGKPLCLLS